MLNTIKLKVVFDRKNQSTKRLAKNPSTGLVQLSITVNGERHFLSTGVKVYSDQFTNGRIVQCHEAGELNERIQEVIRQVTDLVNTCDRKGERFAFAMLDSLFHVSKAGHSWVEWMEQAIKDRPLCPGTRKHHVKVLNYLKEHGYTDTSQMTIDTIIKIDQDLHKRTVNEQPIMATSIYTYHKVLRSYIKQACTVGFLQSNPYDHFRCEKGRSRDRVVLSMEEIRKLAELKTTSLYLQHVRDLFLVQCYTGVAFADLNKINDCAGEIIKGVRQKTKVDFTTVMTEPVREILNRYKGKLPLMAYDDYRRMLTPLMTAAGIDKHVSTHTGRHTFATTVALDHGVPIEVLSKMLGHTSIKTTQIYAKVHDKLVQDNMQKIANAIDF